MRVHILWPMLVLYFSCRAFCEPLLLVTLESPPAEYTVAGTSIGRNVEISKEGLRRMGLDCVVRIVPWKRALKMVAAGTADAIIDAAYNPERAAYLFYPEEEIYVEEWYLFKRVEDRIAIDRDFGNAEQYTLGISRGFQYGGVIQEAIDDDRFKNIQAVTDNRMNIRKLLVGRFDLFVGVKMTIMYLARQMDAAHRLAPVPMSETGAPYLVSASKTYLAFSKKTMTREIADRFSIVLGQMKADGTVKAIDAKYF